MVIYGMCCVHLKNILPLLTACAMALKIFFQSLQLHTRRCVFVSVTSTVKPLQNYFKLGYPKAIIHALQQYWCTNAQNHRDEDMKDKEDFNNISVFPNIL